MTCRDSDHEMVQESSPGPKAFGPGNRWFRSRPERAAERLRFLQLCSSWYSKNVRPYFLRFSVVLESLLWTRPTLYAGRSPLQVGSGFGCIPRAKAWAILLDHFMVITAKRKSQHQRSAFEDENEDDWSQTNRKRSRANRQPRTNEPTANRERQTANR